MVGTLSDDVLSRARELALAVDASGTPVEAAFWKFEDEYQRWRLRLASPHVASKGPLAVYEQIRQQLALMERSGRVPIETDDIRAIAVDDEEVQDVRNVAFSIKPGDVTALPPFSVIWTYGHQVDPVFSFPLSDGSGDPQELFLNFYLVVAGMVLVEVASKNMDAIAAESYALFPEGKYLPFKRPFLEVPILNLTETTSEVIIQWMNDDVAHERRLPTLKFKEAMLGMAKKMKLRFGPAA